MDFEYEFGPNVNFEIRHVGAMKEYNGSYEKVGYKLDFDSKNEQAYI